MEALQITEFAEWEGDVDVLGNIGQRVIRFDYPGQILPGHEHNYPHATALVKGAVRLTLTYPDGRAVGRTLHAPAIFEVPADVRHSMKALEPGTECWCLFAVRDDLGEVVDKPEMKHLRDKSWHERKG